jgi:hypothetical protein
MSYNHQQTGKLHLILLAPVVILLVPMWLLRASPMAVMEPVAVILVLVLIAACFQYLVIRDEGSCLALRYGPFPLFSKRFPYSQMTAADPDRSTLLDGWGIHYMPGRGWIYNLWGCDCVKVQMGRKVVRIGTDDVAGLVEFLRSKIEKPPADA